MHKRSNTFVWSILHQSHPIVPCPRSSTLNWSQVCNKSKIAKLNYKNLWHKENSVYKCTHSYYLLKEISISSDTLEVLLIQTQVISNISEERWFDVILLSLILSDDYSNHRSADIMTHARHFVELVSLELLFCELNQIFQQGTNSQVMFGKIIYVSVTRYIYLSMPDTSQVKGNLEFWRLSRCMLVCNSGNPCPEYFLMSTWFEAQSQNVWLCISYIVTMSCMYLRVHHGSLAPTRYKNPDIILYICFYTM